MGRNREGTSVSRRTVVHGAAWALPVVALAAPAPAFAASTCQGCFLMDWSNFKTHTVVSGSNWKRTANLTAEAGSVSSGCASLQASVQQALSASTVIQTANRSDSRGDFSIGNVADSAVGTWSIDMNNTTGSYGAGEGLVLSQQSGSTSTAASDVITFTFPFAVSSVSFRIYDLTWSDGATAYDYRDTVSFSVGGTATATGDTRTGSALNVMTFSANQQVYRTTHFPSNGSSGSDSDRNVDITLNTAGATSFTMTYSNTDTSNLSTSSGSRNSQWVVIGDLRVCT